MSSYRRLVRLLGPVVGLFLASLLVWDGSNAAFTATTSSATNAWNAGTVTLTNNTGIANAYVVNGFAAFTAGPLKVGATAARCISVRDTSSLAGNVKWYVQSVGGTGLAPQISLNVSYAALPNGTGGTSTSAADCSAFPVTGVTPVYNGPLSTAPTTWAAGVGPWALAAGAGVTENAVYKITWTFNSTGTDAGDTALMNKTATTNFVWEAQ